jgi:DNA topoisomerase VI subunit B
MSNPTLQRTAFETSRLLEFFDEKELQMQIGHNRDLWPLALVKELIDNGLDACDGAGISPVLAVKLEDDAVWVGDNGPGLPAGILRRSLDYSVRVSDKRHYVAPTRGQLGNALKTVWAAPFAINGEHGQVEVWARDIHYTIDVSLDRIAQVPHLELSEEPSDVKNGTIVKMHWPEIASYLYPQDEAYFYKTNLSELAVGYALCNPHMSLSVGEFKWTATDRSWRKWTSSEPTPPHWYTTEDLRNLAAAYIAAGAKKSVREFVSEFRGLSGTAKQKRVVDAAGLSGLTLEDLVVNGDLDFLRLSRLLAQMQAESRPVKAEILGVIGEKHFDRWMQANGASADSVVYRKRNRRGCIGKMASPSMPRRNTPNVLRPCSNRCKRRQLPLSR